MSFYVAIVVPYNATFNSRDEYENCKTERMDVVVEVVFVIGEYLWHHGNLNDLTVD